MKLLHLYTQESYELQRVEEACENLGVTLQKYCYDQAKLNMAEDVDAEVLELISESDGVLSRLALDRSRFAVHVRDALLLSETGLKDKMLNGTSYVRYPVFSKLLQLMILARKGLPIPRSEYKKEGHWGEWPVVVKGLWGNNGRQVHLARNESDFSKIVTRYQKDGYILQAYLPKAEDYRILVLDGKVLGMMKRVGEEFLTNVAAGGETQQVEPEKMEELGALAVAASETFDCAFAGVDVMYDTYNEPKVLEVNRSPGFEGFEAVTDIDVARALVGYF